MNRCQTFRATSLLVLLMTVSAIFAFSQITPSDDSYTLTSSPTANFGAKNTMLIESAGATSFVRFDLSGIPPTVTGSMVAKATLKIFIATVPTAGSFNVDLVTSTWNEKTITANDSPTLGSAIASAVPITTADKDQYVLVDVTAAAVDWLNGTANNGLALVPDGTVSFTLNSKETTSTSHPAELDIVLTGPAGPPGPISGVTAGAGLAGGGTKGNVTLSLLTTCSSGQVLQWNGTTWACATTSGSGTITGVTAGTDLTGGGTSGNVTLNIDTTKVPQLAGPNNFAGALNVAGPLGVGTTTPALMFDVSAGDAIVRGVGNFARGDAANLYVGDTNHVIRAQWGAGLIFGTYLAPTAIFINEVNGHTGVNTGIADTGYQFFVQDSGIWGAIGAHGTNAASGSGNYGSRGVWGQGGNGDPSSNGIGGQGIEGYGGNGYGSGQDGVGGFFAGANNAGFGDGIVAVTGSAWAGYFSGDVSVTGNISKSGGSFKIDHPLDPANKYLYHSFVESPDMMNIYNGNVLTDGAGDAVIILPEWFETLNRDFRYQLTVIGQFAQAIVTSEVASNHFSIKTDKPNVKVSWQVTGIRQDAWANAHRIPVEEAKDDKEHGSYIHPELYGAPEEKSVAWARHPEMMKRVQEHRQNLLRPVRKTANPLVNANLKDRSLPKTEN